MNNEIDAIKDFDRLFEQVSKLRKAKVQKKSSEDELLESMHETAVKQVECCSSIIKFFEDNLTKKHKDNTVDENSINATDCDVVTEKELNEKISDLDNKFDSFSVDELKKYEDLLDSAEKYNGLFKSVSEITKLPQINNSMDSNSESATETDNSSLETFSAQSTSFLTSSPRQQ